MLIRFFDIFFSLLALLFLLPFFIPIILILSLTGEREIFYLQERVGRHGTRFSLLKFATMLKESPSIGSGEITIKNDPRVLPFGRLLRKTKLNELPQLINILLGDISIVGPRPMVPNTFTKYSEEAKTKLSKIQPGLTGIGSIVFRDEELFLNNKEDPRKFYDEHIIPYKNELEIWFFNNNSLLLYFKIILCTAWVILFPKSNIISHLLKNIPKMPSGLQN
jgi:lipopolysaccharide/colanic/teichoic acid biosynthesis glycosyltransferase